MTKKLSILSIVAVLLFSMCFVGCGDDSVAEDDYAKGIIGTWKETESNSQGGFEIVNDSDATIWEFKNNGQTEIRESNGRTESQPYQVKGDRIYLSYTTVNGKQRQYSFRILKMTEKKLHITAEGLEIHLEKQ